MAVRIHQIFLINATAVAPQGGWGWGAWDKGVVTVKNDHEGGGRGRDRRGGGRKG